MKAYSLFLLRVSLALLFLVWGIEMFANVEHGMRVSERFSLGFLTAAFRTFGTLLIILGVLIILGIVRRFVYPVSLVLAGTVLISVWRSIVDPWGWYLEGTNVLYFPSLIIFAGALVLVAYRAEDQLSLDSRGAGPEGFGEWQDASSPHGIPIKAASLLLLRISLGLLMLIWGADKLANVEHGLSVSEGYYFGLFTSQLLLRIFGIFQIILGLLIVLGAVRRFAYPILLVITCATLIGVWRSIVDPWGWYLQGNYIHYFPSLIVFTAALVLFTHRSEDHLSLDAGRCYGSGK
ncbi:MAG: DoxX family membrane protein [Gemmatimonadota bacterium]